MKLALGLFLAAVALSLGLQGLDAKPYGCTMHGASYVCGEKQVAQQGLWGVPAAPTATPPFTHVVVIVQENRSVDNLFQGVSGANTTTTGYISNGSSVTVQPTPLLGGEAYDPGHVHANFVNECNTSGTTSGSPTAFPCGTVITHVGEANGWDNEQYGSPSGCTALGLTQGCTFFYVQDNSGTCGGGSSCTNVKKYDEICASYTCFDNIFATNEGPSFTGHQFLVAGQSGFNTSTAQGSSYYAADADQGGSGCDGSGNINTVNMAGAYPGGIVVSTPNPNYDEHNNASGCLDYYTIFDLMGAAGLTSRYYAQTGGGGDQVLWQPAKSISHLCHVVGGSCTYTGGTVPSGWTLSEPSSNTPCTSLTTTGCPILADINSCSLANLSIVTPTTAQSDHANSATNGQGPLWVSAIINAIGNDAGSCGYWHNTEIIVTYDDWGGWFDHAAPYHPTNGSGTMSTGGNSDPNEFGFRVPLMVVSAYNNTTGTVDHTQSDQMGSVLANIEYTFNLGTSPQCLSAGLLASGAFVPSIGLHGLCQRDAYAQSNLYEAINVSASPASFTAIAMTPFEKVEALAYSSDMGAWALHAKSAELRREGGLALAYAHLKGADTLAFRNRPVDDDTEGAPFDKKTAALIRERRIHNTLAAR
jgi:phospholipase C